LKRGIIAQLRGSSFYSAHQTMTEFDFMKQLSMLRKLGVDSGS
jgi:hypothetical protein